MAPTTELLQKGRLITRTGTTISYGDCVVEEVARKVSARIRKDPNVQLSEFACKGNLAGIRKAMAGGAMVVLKDLLLLAERNKHPKMAKYIKGLLGTRLMEAAEKGDLDGARKALDAGASVNAQDGNGQTALMKAAANGHVNACEWLMCHYVDSDMTDNEGMTAFMHAAANGRIKICRFLLGELGPVDTNTRDRKGRTALTHAEKHGDDETAQYVKNVMLVQAAEDGNMKDVKMLLKSGADINAIGKYYYTALGRAIHEGHADMCRLLVEKGADITKRCDPGMTDWPPLYIARESCMNKETAAYMKSVGEARLIKALSRGNETSAKKLIEAYANVDAVDKSSGMTALMIAAQKGFFEICDLLIEKGANNEATDARDKKGMTALMHAAKAGHEKICKLLLDKERDSTGAKDNSGKTASQIARENGHAAIAKYIDHIRDLRVRVRPAGCDSHW